MEPSVWPGNESIKRLLDQIRASLVEATRMKSVGDRGTEGSASGYAATQSKIGFECGYAKFGTRNQNWVIRHRATTIAPTTSRKRRRESFDSLSFAGTSSPHSLLALRNAKPVAWIRCTMNWSLQSLGGSIATSPRSHPASPPLELVQSILRVVELRSMFEQIHLTLSQEPSESPLCTSRAGKERIDFGPILMLMEEQSASPSQSDHVSMLQNALALTFDAVQAHHTSWVFEVEPSSKMQRVGGQNGAKDVAKAFVRCCLKNDHFVQNDPIPPCQSSSIVGREMLRSTRAERFDGVDEISSLCVGETQIAGEESTPRVLDAELVISQDQDDFVHTKQQAGQPSNAGSKVLVGNNSGVRYLIKNPMALSIVPITKVLPMEAPVEDLGCSSKLQVVRKENLSSWDRSVGPAVSFEKHKELPLRRSSRKRLRWNRNCDEFSVVASSCPRNLPSPLSRPRKAGRERFFSENAVQMLSEDDKQCPSGISDGYGLRADDENIDASLPTRNGGQSPPSSCLGKSASSRWEKLSHVGHVSDYHGLQRKYDSFFPLKFSKSASDTLEAIERTLYENKFYQGKECDEEVLDDSRGYEKALSGYHRRTLDEKQRRKEACGPKEKASIFCAHAYSDVISRPLIFESSTNGATRSSLDVCRNVLSDRVKRASLMLMPVNREIKEDPLDIGSSKQTANSSTERRSRSKDLIDQKLASLMLLGELRHTLRYISSYNLGILRTKEDDRSQLFTNISTGDLTSLVKNKKGEDSKRSVWALLQVAEKCAPTILPEARTAKMNPTSVKICHQGLLEETRQFRRTERLPSTISSLEAGVFAFNEWICMTLEVYYASTGDKEKFLSDQRKVWTRISRGYKGRADQERIEKDEHEEERLLKLRELEYQNRGKKQPAEEVEMERFVSRSILFDASSEKEANQCNFGDPCRVLCKNVCPAETENEKSLETRSIYHPRFQRTPPNEFTENELTGRRSRIQERSFQKVLSMEKLQALSSRTAFLEQYRAGWIVVSKCK